MVCGAAIMAAWAVRCYAQGLWWATPAILLAAGLVPFLARRQSPPAVLRIETLRHDLWTLACTGIVVLPVTYLAVTLIARAGVSLPWSPARPVNYATWAAYQFLYVAVAEEVFFRGYVLTRAMGWLGGMKVGAAGPPVRQSDSGTVGQWQRSCRVLSASLREMLLGGWYLQRRSASLI